MNLPDITLVIQMIHFAVAYWLLRKLVFAPALEIILVQESYQQNIEQKINMAQATKLDTIKKKHTRWLFMKESLYGLIPKLSTVCVSKQSVSESIRPEPITLSKQEQQEVVKLLHDELSDVKI